MNGHLRPARLPSRALLLTAWVFATGVASAQPTTYQYAGAPYLAPTGTFTTAMRISGSFTTANPLPANMPPTAIGPAGDGRAIAWSFSNGIDTFTQANSAELYGNNGNFVIGTDGRGDVSDYSIGLVKPLPPHVVNTPLDFFWIVTGTAVQALDNAPCAIVTVNLCTFVPFLGDGTASDSTESGRFLSNAHAPVPAGSSAGLALLASILAVAGGYAVRREASRRA